MFVAEVLLINGPWNDNDSVMLLCLIATVAISLLDPSITVLDLHTMLLIEIHVDCSPDDCPSRKFGL